MPVQVGFSWRSTQRRWTHTLRPYQQECLDICMDNFSQGVKRQAVSLPVGSGKTVIFSNLIKLIKPPTRLATKTLVLAHRRELLEQAATQIKKAAPDLLVEIDQGTRVASPVADVIVASVPTLGHRTNGRLSRYDPKRFKLVVIDEAHHAAANTYLRVVKHFGQDEADSDTLVWGCSATLFRYDDRDLADVFDKVVYHKHFIAMIREGYLSKIKLTTVRTRNSLENVRRFKGDFAVKALSEAVNNEARNKAIVKAYETMAAGKRKSTLVFAVDVEHAKQLCAMFVNYKIRAEVVLGTTKTAERERILQNFRSGKLPVLVNCGILTEGTDIPNIDCMLMARPTCSPILFQQMLGRGMRLFPGKEDCLVLDFVDSVKRGAQMQITVPSLLGLELDTSFHGVRFPASLSALKKSFDAGEISLGAEDEDPEIANAKRLMSMYKEFLAKLPKALGSLAEMGFVAEEHLNPLNLFELAKKQTKATASLKELELVASGDHGLRKMSTLSWVCITPDRYMLSTPTAIYELNKNPEDDLWNGTRRQLFKKSEHFPFNISKQNVFTLKGVRVGVFSKMLDHAIESMDTLIKLRHKNAVQSLLWNAPWRKQPPSSAQVKLLNKHRFNIPVSAAYLSDRNATKGINRGIASDILTRIRSGSLQWWKEMEAVKEKLAEHQKKKMVQLQKLSELAIPGTETLVETPNTKALLKLNAPDIEVSPGLEAPSTDSSFKRKNVSFTE